MARRAERDDSSDFFKVIERLPFVGTVSRELAELRGLLLDRRAPRILAIGAPESGKTSIVNALLGAEVLPAPIDPASEAAAPPEASEPASERAASDEAPLIQHGSWVEVKARGRQLAWLELSTEAASFTGEPRRRLDNALEEHAPDVLLAIVRADRVEEELPQLVDTLTRLGDSQRRLEREPPDVLVLLSAVDRLCLPVEFARPPYPADVLTRVEALIDHVADAIAKARALPAGVRLARPLAIAAPGSPSLAFQIDELAEAIFERLPDAARVEAARAMPVSDESVRAIARKLTLHFSSIAVVVGLMPIPFSDAVALVPTQGLMVTAIAYVAGQPWDRRAALEWLGSLGVMGGTAVGLRWGAQQLLKFWPGGGTLISASVAGVGTQALGASAIAYFIDGPGRRGRRAASETPKAP